ncbi:MAG: flagellar basal body P-ring formation chaperone FlgA [Rickettsiaceae bacterium]|nr:flagellar basal body P-ring formation chaperone FlgA [Rickettsiaceae bacterium]
MRIYYSFLLIFIYAFATFDAFGDYFEESVKALILEKVRDYNAVDLRFESQSKLDLINSKREKIEKISLTFFSPDTRSFKANAEFDGQIIEIFGKYDVFCDVWVSTKFLKHGKIVNANDIKPLKTKRLQNMHEVVKEVSEIYGKEVKNNITPGQIIKLSDLKNPAVIKENDPITLLYETPGMTIKTLGIALSPGAIGDKIKAKNEKTGILVFGEVMDKNIIKVGSKND